MHANPPSTRRADGVPDDAQRRFDDLLAHLPAGVVMHDAGGRVVAANRQALALLGLGEHEAREGRAADESPADIRRGEGPDQDHRVGASDARLPLRHGWHYEAHLNIKAAVIGAARAEYEYPIPPDDARKLLETLCVGTLEKVRHYVERDGLTWEIDEFLGANAGLVVAEIELDAVDQEFLHPEWLGRELTDDRRYYNHHLAIHPYSTWPDADRH